MRDKSVERASRVDIMIEQLSIPATAYRHVFKMQWSCQELEQFALTRQSGG